MYLPGHLPLCKPHVTIWTGESGRRYDFAVSRPGVPWLDEPAIYILAKNEAGTTKALYVGQTASLHKHFGASMRCPEEWRHALALGMTHVHFRFEACSEHVRQAELRDLVAALRPVIRIGDSKAEESAAESADQQPSPPAASEQPAPPASSSGGQVQRRKRSIVTAFIRPTADGALPAADEAGADAAAQPSRAFSGGRPFRADPAREDAGDLFSPVLVGSPADAFARLSQSGVLRLDAASEQRDDAGVVSLPDTPLDEAVREPAHGIAETPPHHDPVPAAEDEGEPAAAAAEAAASPADAAVAPAAARARRGGMLGWLFRLLRRADVTSAAPAVAPVEATAASPEDSQPATVEAVPAVVAEALTSHEDGVTGEPLAVLAPEHEDVAPSAQVISMPAPAPMPEQQVVPEQPAAERARAIEPETLPETLEDRKRRLGLEPAGQVVLFAGSLDHRTGADILMDAIPVVYSSHPQAQFVFAGDGPLRSDLEERASRAGLAQRCRFLGDVPDPEFADVLAACDFLVLPARERQDEQLARMALSHRKPVLTTHSAQLGLIVHGRNGLVAYDNPHSLVWGVRELLGPLYGDMRRHLAEAA